MQVQANDIFAIKTLSQPAMAGPFVFYQENWLDEAANAYYSRIRQFDRTTRRTTDFGADFKHDRNPQLAPDTKTLAFLSQAADDTTQVFVQPTTGGSARQLTHEPAGIDAFNWAGATAVVYATHTPANTETPFPEPTRITRLQYKLNGPGMIPEKLTYALKRQPLSRKTGKTLFASPNPFELGPVTQTGTTAALTMARLPDDPQDFSDAIQLIDLTTGALTWVNATVKNASFTPAAFSADGQQLLLAGSRNELPNVMQTHLWQYDCGTATLTEVSGEVDLEIGGLIVTDMQQGLSGRLATFVTADYYLAAGFDHGTYRLYAGGPEEPLNLAVGGKRHITDWAVTTDGRGVIFTWSDFTTPSALSYFDLATQEEVQLVNPNTRYLNTHALSAPAHFTFTRDGFALEGWYYPPTEKSAARHPVILDIHGGPRAGFGVTFDHEMQVFAAAGYGVIVMNPRGGLGYGQAFSAAVIGHYGEGDYEDLMQGVEQVLAMDETADPTHVYVTGGSYGGFMTNWIVTHTDRFKAAATQRSISNWLSFYGTSDIGYYFTPWELTGDWQGGTDDFERLWNFSPLKYIKNATTPTLVLHSEQDYRCPIGQGEEFYVGLKVNGVETRFVRFPASNHDLSRSGLPNLRLARLAEILKWFNTHQ